MKTVERKLDDNHMGKEDEQTNGLYIVEKMREFRKNVHLVV